jgi:hypothetical protein
MENRKDGCPEKVAAQLEHNEWYYDDKEGWWTAKIAGMYYAWQEAVCIEMS